MLRLVLTKAIPLVSFMSQGTKYRALYVNVSYRKTQSQRWIAERFQVQQRESGVYAGAARGELLAARGLCQSTEREEVRKTVGVVVSLLWQCPVLCIGALCAI